MTGGMIWPAAFPNSPYTIKSKTKHDSFGCFSDTPDCDKGKGLPAADMSGQRISHIVIRSGGQIDYMRVTYDSGFTVDLGNNGGGVHDELTISPTNRINKITYVGEHTGNNNAGGIQLVGHLNGLKFGFEDGTESKQFGAGLASGGHLITDDFSASRGQAWLCGLAPHRTPRNNNLVGGVVPVWCYTENSLKIKGRN